MLKTKYVKTCRTWMRLKSRLWIIIPSPVPGDRHSLPRLREERFKNRLTTKKLVSKYWISKSLTIQRNCRIYITGAPYKKHESLDVIFFPFGYHSNPSRRQKALTDTAKLTPHYLYTGAQRRSSNKRRRNTSLAALAFYLSKVVNATFEQSAVVPVTERLWRCRLLQMSCALRLRFQIGSIMLDWEQREGEVSTTSCYAVWETSKITCCAGSELDFLLSYSLLFNLFIFFIGSVYETTYERFRVLFWRFLVGHNSTHEQFFRI